MRSKIQKTVMAAMLAALCTAGTMVIKIPSPLGGYVHLGDCIVILCAFLLPLRYAALAAGIGSALADILVGYAAYAPATFVIKAATAAVAFLVVRALSEKGSTIWGKAFAALLGEAVMVLGYFAYEAVFLYGLSAAVNIPMNAVQGIFGASAGAILGRLLEKKVRRG